MPALHAGRPRRRPRDAFARRGTELIGEFRKKGFNIVSVNRDDFRERVVKAIDMKAMGYERKDWDRIQAIK